MSTPDGGGTANQDWSTPAQPGAGYPPPQEYGQPDYSQVQPHYGTPMGTAPVSYASWGQRLGALLIDALFLMLLQLVALLLAALGNTVNESLGVVLLAVVYLGGIIWFILLEAGPYGQTPGKRAVNIRVQKADGSMLTKGGAVGRYFAKILSALPFYLGYLWPLWDAENRTFHDMMLGSRVVRIQKSPPFGQVLKGPFTGSTA